MYRVGELDRRPYIISEYVRGQSLDHLDKPVPWQRALELGVGLARGLAAAHRRGVLHRDIKPANAIIAEDGEVKLLDFGLAKLTEVEGMTEERRPGVAPVKLGVEPTGGPGRAFAATMQVPELAVTTGQILAASVAASAKLTRAGVVMGTPDYMAPELFRVEQATRRSDVYALGALLYELCSGHSPFRDVPYRDLPQHLQDHDAPSLSSVAPSVGPRFAAIIDRCLAREPGRRFPSADELRDELEQLTPAARPTTIPEGNPFRGLAPFEAEHRALFFGRSGAVRGVLERLRTDPFVLVAGDSGVGKSSLCRAGVLPLCEQGGLDEDRRWRVITMVPGRRPISALARACAGLLERDEAELAQSLRRDAALLAHLLRNAVGRQGGVVLFVDQLEEVVTLSDATEANELGAALAELAVGASGVRLLATVRGDFVTRLAAVHALGEEVPRAMYLLRPLGTDAMREAIVGPAQAKGYRFESESLVETLVRSSQRAEGGLPLLQFALAELWDARDEATRSITAEALVRIGGVEGALERHADGVIGGLLPAQRGAARRLLTRLVTIEGTRARRTEQGLGASDPPARAALDALVRGRLLVPRDLGDGTTSYEVAHEALLTGWGTLRDWLAEEVEQRAVKHRIELAAAEWERLSRARDALWNARRLAEIGALDPSELAPREIQFLQASRRGVARARVLRASLAVGVIALVVGVYSGLRIKAAHDLDSEVSRRAAEARAIYDATSRRREELDRVRLRAFQRFDAQGDDAEALWEQARTLSAEIDRGYGGASQVLEEAIHRGGHARADVRALMADVLLQRALLADQDHRATARDELVHRLAVYDDDGARLGRWAMPSVLSLSTDPPVARTKLVVRRVDIDAEKRRRIGAVVHSDDAAMGSDLPLPPGPYIATIDAPGHATATVPLLLGRGASVRLRVPLVRADEVPAGFVYVPAGEFLYGTTDESLRRQYFYTAPLHSRATDSFFIAQNETTFADWIEFLSALPAGRERDARLPKSGTAGVQGALALTPLPRGGWSLSIQPTTTTYTLALGEPLVYAARPRGREQDWRRLPVSGISAHDALAYAAWLDRTGKVPGARLCTELEWERAARGADGRRFPHGDEVFPADANFETTYGANPATRGPDSVGSHPQSRSPFGVEDMSGNVWEWVRSSTGDEYHVRGGAYGFDGMASVSYKRELVEPTLRDITLGLRVCATPPARTQR